METLLSNSKISHTDVTLTSQEQVLGLQITVQDTAVVKVFETAANFSTVEAGSLLIKSSRLLEMEEELTTVDVVHDKVQLVGGLERVVKVDKERVNQLLQNVLLGLGVIGFVSFHNVLLVEDLHGKDLLRSLPLDQQHLPEASLANDLQFLEIILGDLFFFLEGKELRTKL